MKILIIHTLYKPYILGGAEKVVELMAMGFKELGLEVEILTLGPKSSKVSKEVIDGISVIRLPIKNIYYHYNFQKPNIIKRTLWHLMDIYNLVIMKDVENVLKENKPDICVFHNIAGFSSSLWLLFKKYNIPTIQVLHDLYAICPNSNMFNGKEKCKKQCFKCRIFRLLHPYFSNNVDAVIGVSKFVLDKHLEYGYFKNSKIKTYIHNCLKIDKLPEINITKKEKVVFGFIGTLNYQKGIELLLETFKILNDKNILLLVAGKGKDNYENYLKNKYSLDNVKFLGYVNSNEFFKKIDVLVVPSIWDDTLPTVILEAFVNGIPVIGSKRGGIPELVNYNNGWLFEPNINSLKEVIEEIIINPDQIYFRKKFVIENRSNYIDFNKWILRYKEVIDELIKG